MRGRNIPSERITRVVVRGANWVGDAVMTIPALRELRRVLPGAHITLATRPWAEGVFADADFLDELLVIGGHRRRGLRALTGQISEWRRRRFDLAILFPNAFAPAFISAAARVPRRLGYATSGRGMLLTDALAVPEWRGHRHEVFYYLNIIAALERTLTGTSQSEAHVPRLDLHISPARKSQAREMLRAAGATLERPLIAICPGSTNSRAKRWPAERFAALADRLIEESGAAVALIGSREELDVSQEVAAHMRFHPIMLTGQTDLAQTVAILGLTDLLVTNDTGPAHIAAAVMCPTLVIFGPTDPVTTRPFSPVAEIVRRAPDCAPCMLRDCPIDHRCMTAITPAEVFERARAVIRQRSGMETMR